jgi:hypothetical protein
MGAAHPFDAWLQRAALLRLVGMHWNATLRIASTLVFAAAAISPSHALPLTLDSGQSIGFNVDLTGQVPAPPYTNSGITVEWTSITTPGNAVQIDVYRDSFLGGGFVETLLALFDPIYPPGTSFGAGFGINFAPADNDGVFSVKLTALAGRISLVAVTGDGEIIRNNQSTVAVVDATQFDIPAQTVPTPGSLALSVLALALLPVARRPAFVGGVSRLRLALRIGRQGRNAPAAERSFKCRTPPSRCRARRPAG